MNPQIEEGAKAGIGIAIRRGDLNLLKTCFDLLWGKDPNSLTRKWLRWRLPLLVMHDAVYLMGEYCSFYDRLGKTKVVANSKEEERAYRAFMYKLAAALKVRDAPALVGLSKLAGKEEPAENHILDQELVKTYGWLQMAEAFDMLGIDAAAQDLYDHLTHRTTPPGFFNALRDDYHKKTINYLFSVAKSAGTYFDRSVALAAMVIWGRRPFNEGQPAAAWKERIDSKLKGIEKPKTVGLPWYVFDPTTSIGQRVLKKMKDKGTLSLVWLHAETFKIPKDDLQIKPVAYETRPHDADTVWWIPYLRAVLSLPDCSAKQSMLQWKTHWRDSVKNAVTAERNKLAQK